MVKYKLYVKEMLDQNKEVFDHFREIHDKYCLDPELWQEKFNTEGKIVSEAIRRYENRLCGKTERGQYGVFSAKLSEKFHEELRKIFPKIDFIGITVENPDPPFMIKKIKL